jgi:cyclopropane fatty-acyl-phospholipid synthase-like methyltransferase
VSLKQLVPASLRPAARSLYHVAFRTRLRAEWWLRDQFERHPPGVVVPPAQLRFRVGEDSRLAAFLEVGRRTAENLDAALGRAGSAFTPGQTVLDFGCGCGRTLRWLIERYPGVRWHGVDVDAEAIAWCQANIPAASFICGSPLPPLPFADASLDMIYAISVFTHLNEGFQRAWIAELERVLKPGGMLLLSLYSEHVWREQPEAATVEAGGFVFRKSEKLKGILPDWYHTALQSHDRVTSMLRERFSRVSYQERALGDHDAVIAWK